MLEPPDISAVVIANGKMLTLYIMPFSRVNSRATVTVLIPKNSEILTTTFDGAAYNYYKHNDQ